MALKTGRESTKDFVCFVKAVCKLQMVQLVFEPCAGVLKYFDGFSKHFTVLQTQKFARFYLELFCRVCDFWTTDQFSFLFDIIDSSKNRTA